MKQAISLDKGETWKLPSQLDAALVVQSGAVWVTYAGVTKDFVFQAGDSVPAALNGTRPLLGALFSGTTLVLNFDE